MKVYDVILEYPNGATEVRKTECSIEAAEVEVAKLQQQLLSTTDGCQYKVYCTKTVNTLRKDMRAI